MFFIRKIYYNNKPLLLTNDLEELKRRSPAAEGYASFTGAFSRNFRQAIEHLSKIRTIGAVIEDESPESLLDELHRMYKPVEAGGGVVLNEHNDVLMIYRRGKWDLPKGKKDNGEDIALCALREVKEETGLNDLKLKDKICETYHVYAQNGESLLKRTTWYRMKGNKNESLIPQKEENILEAKWVPEKELGPIVFKSYEAIREVLKQAGVQW